MYGAYLSSGRFKASEGLVTDSASKASAPQIGSVARETSWMEMINAEENIL
jgi:hypothetical protein